METVANPFGPSVVLGHGGLPAGLDAESDADFSESATVKCGSLWRDALDLLTDHAPPYAEWVQRGVRAVIPVDNPPEVLISGSDDRRPGTISASINTTVDGMAEILVHEATHQYMFAAVKASPLDDGTDTALYYSPVKGAQRPISKILIAFHAVGNVLLLAMRLTESGHDRDHYWQKNLDRLGDQITALDEVLTNSTSLTHVGDCLFLPLRRALADNGLLT
jgi:HEXXH motif-containing protein